MDKWCIFLAGVFAIMSNSIADNQDNYAKKSTANTHYQLGQQTRIVPTDNLGNRVPGQQYEIRGHKIIPIDHLGNRLPGNHYQIKGDKIYQTDYLGNIQPNQPSFAIKK